MSDAIRQERCAEVASCVMVLIQAIFGGKTNPEQLAEARPAIERLQEVIEAGAEGIVDDRYLQWLRGAPANVRAIERAVDAGDADAAFVAFRDPAAGLHLLTAGCEGCAGW